MIFTTPGRRLKEIRATGELTRGGNGILALNRGGILSCLRTQHKKPTSSQYEVAAKFLTKLTGLEFSGELVEEILGLFPFARIEVAEGKNSSAVCRELKNVAGHFILGCRWPVYQDTLDMGFFLEAIRIQGEKMGFSRAPENPPHRSPEDRRASFVVISSRLEQQAKSDARQSDE